LLKLPPTESDNTKDASDSNWRAKTKGLMMMVVVVVVMVVAQSVLAL